MLRALAIVVAGLALGSGGEAAAAVELRGQVIEVRGSEVLLRIEGDQLPRVGDAVRISFRIPGGPEVRVGTGTVSRVSGDEVWASSTGTPQRGQLVTIASASPTRRGGSLSGSPSGPAAPAPGTPAPGGGAPGPSAPGLLDITRRDLPVGPLALGDGRRERAGAAYVIVSSTDYVTFEPIATEPAAQFHAAVRVRAERGSGDRALVGLLIATAPYGDDFQEGDLFFGKDEAGLLVQRWEGGRWVDVPRSAAPATPPAAGAASALDVTKRGGRYELVLDGARVATLPGPAARADWVRIMAGAGSRAELLDWRVERPR
jgi:hypothetical protein